LSHSKQERTSLRTAWCTERSGASIGLEMIAKSVYHAAPFALCRSRNRKSFPKTTEDDMSDKRSAFQQKVVEALLDSKAINIEAIGLTMSKFGEQAAREGEPLTMILNKNVIINCGWPGPEFNELGGHRINPQTH
jgi:hypothetical protein